jgi:hypothetical protein
MSSSDSKWDPFKGIFNFGNSKCNSGQNCGSIVDVPTLLFIYLARNCCVGRYIAVIKNLFGQMFVFLCRFNCFGGTNLLLNNDFDFKKYQHGFAP